MTGGGGGGWGFEDIEFPGVVKKEKFYVWVFGTGILFHNIL